MKVHTALHVHFIALKCVLTSPDASSHCPQPNILGGSLHFPQREGVAKAANIQSAVVQSYLARCHFLLLLAYRNVPSPLSQKHGLVAKLIGSTLLFSRAFRNPDTLQSAAPVITPGSSPNPEQPAVQRSHSHTGGPRPRHGGTDASPPGSLGTVPPVPRFSDAKMFTS